MTRNPKGYKYFKCCVRFAVKYEPRQRPQKMPYCPLCGDDVDVKKYVRKQASWTEEQKAELWKLHTTTTLSYSEIAKQMGRTKKSISHKLERLRHHETIL